MSAQLTGSRSGRGSASIPMGTVSGLGLVLLWSFRAADMGVPPVCRGAGLEQAT
jgi:hypothetical protein